MSSISRILTHDHRACDQLFAVAEEAAAAGRWGAARAAFAAFRDTLEAHLRAEEEILFPAFERATGIRVGPTQVMRQEHGYMRLLLEAMAAALDGSDADEYANQAQTLLVFMQQHNLKEEGVLYPAAEQQIPQASALARTLRERVGGEDAYATGCCGGCQ